MTTQTLTLTNQRAAGTLTDGSTLHGVTMWDVANDGRALTTLHGKPVRIVDVQQSDDGTIYVGTVQQTRKGTDYVRYGYVWTSVEHIPQTMAETIEASVQAVTAPQVTVSADVTDAVASLDALEVALPPSRSDIKIIDPVTGATLRTISDPLRSLMIRSVVKYMCSRAITCALTGQILDARTCVVAIAADDDVIAVWSPEGWRDRARPRWELLLAQTRIVGVTSQRASSLKVPTCVRCHGVTDIRTAYRCGEPTDGPECVSCTGDHIGTCNACRAEIYRTAGLDD